MLKSILGISPPRVEVNKEDDFDTWYEQVVVKGEMIDHCSLPGYFILKVCLLRVLPMTYYRDNLTACK